MGTTLSGGHNFAPLIEIGLTYLPKISGDKSPLSPYVPTGLVFSRDNNNIEDSAAKPDPFFRVKPNLVPKIRVELGQVGPQGKKTGPIGLGWPQIGFKFGFNPIMYLMNPNEPNLEPIWNQFWVKLGPQGPNWG